MSPSLNPRAFLDIRYIAPICRGSKPGSGVALVLGMGAYLDAFDDQWTSSAELDEGWGLDDEAGVIPRAVRPRPTPTL